MTCDGDHLGFPIGIKTRNLAKAIPMIIHLQFGFSQFISFREEDLWNFSQSEHIIGPGSHVEYLTGTKNRNFVEDHPKNIPAKYGSNLPRGFGSLKCEKFTDDRRQKTDDGRQVMAIVHLDLWSRWTKNRRWKILMWFTEAYIKTVLVKLIFKTFTIENSKKKGQNILPRPGIHSLLFRLAYIYPRQFFQYGTKACYIGYLEKSI
jgi:hypothetical protein